MKKKEEEMQEQDLTQETTQQAEQTEAAETNAEGNAEANNEEVAETTAIDTPVYLRGATTEELYEKVKAIREKYDGHKVLAGPAAQNCVTGEYIIQVDII